MKMFKISLYFLKLHEDFMDTGKAKCKFEQKK